jgi:hypothetical protein
VSTDLFVAARGFDPEALGTAIPPACRRSIDPPASAGMDGDDAVIVAPEWVPRAAVTQLLPSLSALGGDDTSARLEISARVRGEWTPWIGGASLGPETFSPLPSSCPGLACDIDVFASAAPVDAVRLRARVRGGGAARALEAPWLLALSAWTGAVNARPARGPGASLVVPPRSQLAAGGGAARNICSPTSVAMVLEYWRAPVDTLTLAAEIYQPALDRYGVWPAAIRAAARHGVAGYLLRFPDWASAAWCLERGLPIVASVRYAPGELTAAAIPETTGHLLVITGYDTDTALVNDPIAPTIADVPRRYRLDELARVWLERTGVGYVLFKP